MWNFLTSLGLKKIHLEINSVGCPNCLDEYETALKAYYKPHLSELCGDCQNRFEVNPKRLLDCKVPSCGVIAAKAPSQLDYLDEDCRNHFEQVQHYLKLANIEFEVNPRIVRGLDYYSHTAFEVIFDGLGAQNTLAGGEDTTIWCSKWEADQRPPSALPEDLNACCWPWKKRV